MLSPSSICVAMHSGNSLQSDHPYISNQPRLYNKNLLERKYLTCQEVGRSAFEAVRPYDPHYTKSFKWPLRCYLQKAKHGSITAPAFLPRMPENIWLCKDPVSLHLQIHIFKVKCCIEYMGDNGVTINYRNTSLAELQLNKSMVEQYLSDKRRDSLGCAAVQRAATLTRFRQRITDKRDKIQ